MNTSENIEDFYKNKFNILPDDLKKGLGHFNVFKRAKPKTTTVRYSRRDYFKITLLKGKVKIHYANKTIQSDKYALLFSDPLVPYSWEPLDTNQSGSYCIFTEEFFYQFGNIRDYPIFKPEANKALIIDENHVKNIEAIYQKMFEEIDSDYIYKYDVLRNLVFELIHYGMKLEPTLTKEYNYQNRHIKIVSLFTELLQRQFPIESPYNPIKLKAPKDFAKYLNIHTNHLNKTLKQEFGKTTSQIISERIAKEAVILLKHTTWSISDIAFSLKFEEPPHFIAFFKKYFNQTPKKFRDLENI